METVTKFDPSTFTVDNRWWVRNIWGGGHTAETDPTQRGWRAARVTPNSAVLVGRRGKPGCFSAIQMSDGTIEVALYVETPEEVAASWKKGEVLDCPYRFVPNIPGWALPLIAQIERDRA